MVPLISSSLILLFKSDANLLTDFFDWGNSRSRLNSLKRFSFSSRLAKFSMLLASDTSCCYSEDSWCESETNVE